MAALKGDKGKAQEVSQEDNNSVISNFDDYEEEECALKM